MPAGSFTLVFDNDGIPDKSFDILHWTILRVAAWQEAVDRKSADVSDSYTNKCSGSFHIRGFPRILKNILEGKTCIRFTFPINNTWNPDDILQEINSSDDPSSDASWTRLYLSNLIGRMYRTSPPLPTWADIKLDEIIWSEDLLQRKMWIFREGAQWFTPP